MALLTLVQLKEHIPGLTLADAALTRLLDAAEQSILEVVGSPGTVTELHQGGRATVFLTRRAASVTSITENLDGTHLVLVAGDYRIASDGHTVTRLATGDNPAPRWSGPVSVVLEAFDDAANRKRVQLALVRLDLGYSGFEGDNAPAFSRPPAYYEARRRESLDSLRPLDPIFA